MQPQQNDNNYYPKKKDCSKSIYRKKPVTDSHKKDNKTNKKLARKGQTYQLGQRSREHPGQLQVVCETRTGVLCSHQQSDSNISYHTAKITTM